MKPTKEEIINAIGQEAYDIAQKFISMNGICPYDEAFTVKEMLEETGRCNHCFVPQCPVNCLTMERLS